jgi:hypothetical protein
MNNPPKSFAEQARELKAAQEAAAASQQATDNIARERQRRIDNEGPAAAQQLAAHIIADVKKQVTEAGPDSLFRLPAQPQRGAALEVIVADKWLLTGQPSGSQFTVGTFNLTWLNNPRARHYGQGQEDAEFVVYQIDLDNSGVWGWKEGEDTAMRGIFMPTLSASKVLSSDELVDRILSRALALAKRSPTGEGSGAGGFYFG